jgi:CheY-like chemotaxis protein
MGAQETIRALRKIKPGIKAMVMSRYGDDPAMVEPKAHGFGAALGKPFDIETLKRALAQVLGSQK